MRVLSAALVLAGTIAVAGCSGDDDNGAATTLVSAPAVTEAPATSVEDVPPSEPDGAPAVSFVVGTLPADMGLGGELPLPDGFRTAEGLSEQCEAAVAELRSLMAEYPNPFALPDDAYGRFDEARFAAFGAHGCDVDEWAEFNAAELSPWSAGQYPNPG